ncbi:MAG: pyruvate dehydrogenase (acetyl-transferring), homodimeric type [Planctomycetota bacterium]|nr:MAG: pyruvate dehydrogenase (acetyl-transferring), homodimeric type [Planctomycetota bacterium]
MSDLNQKPLHDTDPIETREWMESLDSVLRSSGTSRAKYLMKCMLEHARHKNYLPTKPLVTDYINTIPHHEEPSFPGDAELEKRLRLMIRWNAAVMVHRTNERFPGLGGHLSSYASVSTLFEIGFNHFFRGKGFRGGSGDQVFFQGHASPGIYARSFLEGSISEEQLHRFRREVERGKGLSSYPHPRLMPDYWEFPTVSMGLGPIAAIYQARFNKYLKARGIVDTSSSRVWCFMGDGESDEPESLGALSVAAREGLDNLIFVVNCNLQRLDGPVRGNGKIIQELEAVFRGSGWNVLKVVWGSEWDELIDEDHDCVLRQKMNKLRDGHWQKFSTMDGAEIREEFFGSDPRLRQMVEHLSDTQLEELRRGGHDHRKVYAAFKRAVKTAGRPTAILAHTIKGWGLGEGFEAANVTHQMKHMNEQQLRTFRDRLRLPIDDSELHDPPFYHPGENSEEVQYLKEHRAKLGGTLPKRRSTVPVSPPLPKDEIYAEFDAGTAKGKAGVSTTIAFVRLLSKLIKDKDVGKFIVPIIPDEARTFGMDPFFRMVGIYAQKGQLYEPVDKGLLLYYREASDGQVLEEGITEAGAMASFTAAGTSYSTHGQTMIPFYTFYSMFGFQRTGDQIWAFGDMRGRGFLLGATAGRTTLSGEGLQHQDGHSQLMAAAVPNLRAYDPAFAYEIAHIIRDGMRRMVGENEDCFYYLTLQNENYPMPVKPEGCDEGILRGLYLFEDAEQPLKAQVQLMGSGSIMNEVLRARDLLAERFGVSAKVWSATSYQQLRYEALRCERVARLHPEQEAPQPWITQQLQGAEGPFIAAGDWIKAVPELVARWIPGRFVPLGTDGYGMSDTRESLRRHFEIDAESIVIAALSGLMQDGKWKAKDVQKAIEELDYDPEKLDPMSV